MKAQEGAKPSRLLSVRFTSWRGSTVPVVRAEFIRVYP